MIDQKETTPRPPDSAIVRSAYRDRADALALAVASRRRHWRGPWARVGRWLDRVAPRAANFPAVLSYNDPREPYPVLYIHTPAGQLSFHIHPDDLSLFRAAGVEVVPGDDPRALWDGSTKNDNRPRILQALT